MNILLLHDVKGIGRRMEVKTVKDGYARNFLIPRKLAKPADQQALAEQHAAQEREASRDAKLRNASERLPQETFTFALATGPNGEIYSSVSAAQIQQLLAERGFGDVEVALAKPIRALGEHAVEVRFGRGIRAAARIRIEPAR